MRYLFLSIMALFLIACSNEAKAPKDFAVGDKITLKSYNNKTVTLIRTEHGFKDAQHPDNALLIDVFGTFCPPCRQEAPELFDLASKHDKLSLVALSYAENASDEKLKEFATSYNAFYFLSNDPKNNALVAAITKDIDYDTTVQLPFKVLLKNGEYQNFGDLKFLLGLDRSGLLSKSVEEALAK